MSTQTDTATFGQVLRRYRQAAALSQQALAERAGLSVQAVSQLERGARRAPHLETVHRLAGALGLDAAARAALLTAARPDPGGPTTAGLPSLRPLARPLNNLPVQPTPLIGRQREAAAVGDLLRRPTVRLVTLTGAGGTGKTRLGLHVATEALADVADGVFFVPLAHLTDPELVVPAIAHALGVTEAGDQPLPERLHEHLRTNGALLLLDNFEQVTAAAPAIAELLAACPRLRVLVTSRAPLRVRGEHEYSVPPLSVPDLAHLPGLPALTQYEAVRLFIERARDVNPDFAVSNETAPVVAEICARLDGLPLAIELAAARIRLFPPPALLQRLSSRLTVLTGGPRDLPARQQTLRGAIDWSYSLLSRDEQRLFAQLGVFAGGCTVEAAEAVCAAAGALDIVDGLTSLVEKSLLRQDGTDQPRLVMLETMREYALERLEQGADAPETRRAHAAYVSALVDEARAIFDGGVDPAWLDRLESEHGNLRAALAWLLAQGEEERALHLAAGLWRLWWIRGYIREGRAWLDIVLARTPDVPSADRAIALRAASHLALEQQDLARAQALADAAVALARRVGDDVALGDVLMTRGLCAQARADLAAARRFFEEALALTRALGRTQRVGIIVRHLGQIAGRQGDATRAIALLDEGVSIHRALNDVRSLTLDYLTRGDLAERRNDPEQAGAHYRASLTLARQVGARSNMVQLLHALARLVAARGEPARATQLLAAAQGLSETLAIALGAEDHERREQCLARVHADLGDDAFAAAWAEGQALWCCWGLLI